MNNILHSVRLGGENWIYEDRLVEVLGLLKKYPCGIGQVSMFTSPIHSPLAMEEMKRRIDIMKDRMKLVRSYGLEAGINILATIGHHNEDLKDCYQDTETYRMTNIDGEACEGSHCMNDARYIQNYVVPVYEMLAKAEPDYIWIDDDIRYGHMPIGSGCFCDGCIELFNKNHGTHYTREALKAALTEKNTELRKRWLQQQSDAITHLFEVIAKTVYDIDDTIKLGFMTGERYMEGYDFETYAKALSQNGKYEIMWRPGGGAYTDYSFEDIVEKGEQVGRQNAYLPDYVTIIQSEIENFPYNLIKKTPTSTAAESLLHMISGCTGAAWNIWPSETMEPVNTIEAHLKAIQKTIPFAEVLQEKLKGTKQQGIHTGWRINSQAAVPEGPWWQMGGGMYAAYARELFGFGMPECYDKSQAQVHMLHGEVASVMEDAEILELLKGGLVLDGGALTYINERGFGKYTGFEVMKEVPVDAREILVEDPVNEGMVGIVRNCRQAFNPGDSYALRSTQKAARVLSRLIDYHDRELADCASGLYENELGGRVFAAGYYPYSWISDYCKTLQLKKIFMYLSKDTLPAYMESYCRVRLTAHKGNGRYIITLLNTSNEPLEDLTIYVNTENTEVHVYTQKHPECPERKAVSDRRIMMDSLPPFETVIIEVES